MSGIDARCADLSEAQAADATLDGANFTAVILSGANVAGASFRGTNLRGALLVDIDFDQAIMEDAKVILGTARLSQHLQVALRDHTLWVDSNGAEGARADLSDAKLSGSYQSGRILRNCNLSWAWMAHYDFVLADLAGANLMGTDLRFCNFRGAKLTESNFGPALIDGGAGRPASDRRPANLTGASLTKAELTGTDLGATNTTDTIGIDTDAS
jgi:uncharacterized protein YjbI with pentapeptide repeats